MFTQKFIEKSAQLFRILFSLLSRFVSFLLNRGFQIWQIYFQTIALGIAKFCIIIIVLLSLEINFICWAFDYFESNYYEQLLEKINESGIKISPSDQAELDKAHLAFNKIRLMVNPFDFVILQGVILIILANLTLISLFLKLIKLFVN